MGVITTIRRNVKNGGRCSVFVDEEFFAACPIDVALALGLRKGLEMTPELEGRLRTEDRRMVLRQKSYRFAMYKPRTERQMHDHLLKLEATPEEAIEVLEWLRELRVVDDRSYVERFVAAANERKPLSPADLRRKLKAKGVADDVIAEQITAVMDDATVQEAARRVAEKKLRTLRESDPDERRTKLVRFLQYRGYAWSVVRSVIDDLQLGLLLITLAATSAAVTAQTILTCDKTRLPESINAFQPTTQPVLAPDGRLFLDRKLHPQNTDGITDPDDVWIAEPRSAIAWSEPTQAPFTSVTRPDVIFGFTPDFCTALVVGSYGIDRTPRFALLHRASQTIPFDSIEVLEVGDLGANYYGTMSVDGRTVILALDREGGLGDLDLYVMQTCGQGWSLPVSLGSALNTAGLDGSPWLAADGRTLYFVSNGREDRRGKMDVYRTQRTGADWQRWTPPRSMGPCVNTQEDEASVSLTLDGSKAFLTSWDAEAARPGIYQVTVPFELRPDPVCVYEADVVDGVTDQPIPSYRISVHDTADVSGCADLLIRSDTATGRSVIVIPEGHSQVLETYADGYTTHRQTISVRDLDSTVPLRTTVRLFRMDRPLVSVYFERGSSELSPAAIDTILAFAARYQAERMRFFVDGYADRVGLDNVNRILSGERADRVAEQLRRIGIAPERIIRAGRGVEQVPNTTVDEHPESRRVDIYARTES